MEADEQAVRDTHAIWIEAVNAGDLARLLAIMTDDAVFLNPGQAPFGRDEFTANFLGAHQRVRIECISELEEVVVAGDIAYTRARDSLSVTARDGGGARNFSGHRMTIYRKLADGRWRLARDAHTLQEI